MPLVRIALRAGTPPADQHAIADGVHQALVETINIPQADRFQLISEYEAEQRIREYSEDQFSKSFEAFS